MPMSKPNVPKFVCCIHVSVPNTTTYSAIRAASTSAGARAASVEAAPGVETAGRDGAPGVEAAGVDGAPGVDPRGRGSTSVGGDASDSSRVVFPALKRARVRRNDCANARERVSTAGVYGYDQGSMDNRSLEPPRLVLCPRLAGLPRAGLALLLALGAVGPCGGAAAQFRGDELVEVPVQDRLDVARLDPSPVVLDHLVGVQHVRADLVA